MATRRTSKDGFAICLRNDGYPASLEVRKVYAVIPDAAADSHGLIRVVDESGEDYLYPADFFHRIAVSAELERALRLAS